MLRTSTALAAAPVNLSLNFTRDGQALPVQFRVWLPDAVDRFRGIVVNLPGSAGDTRNVTTNGTFQARLPGMGFGIVGMKDLLGDSDVTYWGTSAAEGQANLQVLLDAIASAYNHPEISNAPVIFDGLSKGGYSADYIATLAPARTIGYVADKGFGSLADGQDQSILGQLPGLMVAGSADTTVTPASLYFQFHFARTVGAKLAMAMDWGVGHSATNSAIRFAFFDHALRARYPQGQLPSVIPGNPLPLVNDFADPWLGQSNTLDTSGTVGPSTTFLPVNPPQIAPQASYVPDPPDQFGYSDASWLPGKAAAMVYRAQNDKTFATRPLQISIANAPSGEVDSGVPIDLQLTLSSVTSNHIEVYDEDQLIAVLNQSAGTQNVFYTPTEVGLHTFIAIADYLSNGVTMSTSNYAVVGVNSVPEPTSALCFGVAAMTLRRRRQAC